MQGSLLGLVGGQVCSGCDGAAAVERLARPVRVATCERETPDGACGGARCVEGAAMESTPFRCLGCGLGFTVLEVDHRMCPRCASTDLVRGA